MKTSELTNAKLCLTWSDGRTESLWSNLPEYLREEISAYLHELEEHMAEVGEEYNFTTDTGELKC
jgi:hypothetical protein